MQSYIRRLALALDRFLNVLLLGGTSEQTVSISAAIARRDGKAWGCILCRWLSWTVERGHCEKALNDIDTEPAAGIRAFVQLIIVSGLVYYAPLLIHWMI